MRMEIPRLEILELEKYWDLKYLAQITCLRKVWLEILELEILGEKISRDRNTGARNAGR